MATKNEDETREWLSSTLETLAPGRFGCRERKNSGRSVISKPADLEIFSRGVPTRPLIAVEVANVNTTQLVGEACRLFYDACPRKLLVLDLINTPPKAREQCEAVLCRLYAQDQIADTSARVVSLFDTAAARRALLDLLVLDDVSASMESSGEV